MGKKILSLALIFVLFWGLIDTKANAYTEPPFLTVGKVQVLGGPETRVILKTSTNKTILLSERTQFTTRPQVQIKNDKNQKGLFTFIMNGDYIPFKLSEKIELDDYRLPYWLVRAAGLPNATGQTVGLEVVKMEEGDKQVERFDVRHSCSVVRYRDVCRRYWEYGRWVVRCYPESYTLYGDQIDRHERSVGVDLYQARMTAVNGDDVVTLDFDVKKDQDKVIERGRCSADYYDPYPGPYPHPGPYYP